MIRPARWMLSHRVFVLVAWLALAAAGAATAPHTVSSLTYDFSLPGQPSTNANERILSTYGNGGRDPVVLSVTVPEGTTVTSPQTREQLTALESQVVAALPGARTASFASTGDTALVGSGDRTTAVLVYPRPLPSASPYGTALKTLQRTVSTSTVAGAPVLVTGVDALKLDTGAGRSVLVEVVFGAVGALIVLALVFGSFLALLPLVIAAFSILTTFLLVGGLTTVTDVSFIVEYLIALIGLGVAIDYSLLVVTRWREALGNGAIGDEAIVTAMSTAGRAVTFSGVTVGVSLVSLLLLPVPFLRSVGITGLLIPLISVAASVTLLPVLLHWLGRRLSWPHRRSADPHSKLWGRVARGVRRAPVPAAVLSAALLVVLALPALGIRLASADPGSIAQQGAAAQGYSDIVEAGIPVGVFQPVQVLTNDVSGTRAALSGVAGIGHVLEPPSWQQASTRVLDVWTQASAASHEGAGTVDAVASTLANRSGTAVGGTPTADRDFVSAVYGNAWLVVGLVALLTFLLLARAFRSVLLPIKALLLNVLSIAAAYGVAVFIWQDGHLTTELFGTTGTGAITTWVPVAVFAFVFGLSMDYEVFILTRMREVWDETGSNSRAVDEGLATTGRLVTSAALILFLAFVALATVPVTDVKTFATALAAGIAIDAIVVRTVLTPALVVLLGKWNWWLPRWAGGRSIDTAPHRADAEANHDSRESVDARHASHR